MKTKTSFLKNSSLLNSSNKIPLLRKGKVPYQSCELIENNGSYGWYIQFKYMDPETGELVRGLRRLRKERSRFETDLQARRYIINNIIKEIDKNLAEGWTPKGSLVKEISKEDSVRSLLDAFMNDKADLRKDTLRVYRSASKLLNTFLIQKNLKTISIYDFGEKETVMLRKFAKNRGYQGVTFNNYRRMWSNFFNWVIKEERLALSCNPIASFLKSEKEEYTPRLMVPHEYDETVMQWCVENDPVLLLVISLVSGPSFLRPQEILRLRIGDIDLEKNQINISAWQAKTKSTVKIINDETALLLKKFKVESFPSDYFLIDKENARFGKLKIGRPTLLHIAKAGSRKLFIPKEEERKMKRERYLVTRDIDKNWEKLRAGTDIPQECQLYSYRHRCISDLYGEGYTRDQISQLTGHISEAFWHYVSASARGEVAEKVARECIPVLRTTSVKMF